MTRPSVLYVAVLSRELSSRGPKEPRSTEKQALTMTTRKYQPRLREGELSLWGLSMPGDILPHRISAWSQGAGEPQTLK